MATLHIFYDLDSMTIRKASAGGMTIPGVSSVGLRNGFVSLLDVDGRDLLTARSTENPDLQLGVAKLFGYEEERTTHLEDEPESPQTNHSSREIAELQAKIAQALGGQS